MKDVELYKELHLQDQDYGASGGVYFKEIADFIRDKNPKVVLDYGCGKGALSDLIVNSQLQAKVHSYDPAIKGKETIPLDNYDMIITTDVLEHLYEDEIDFIFSDMLKLKPVSMYHIVSHRLAHAILPDGSNAHKTVQAPEWWANRMKESFLGYEITYHYTDVGHFKVCKK